MFFFLLCFNLGQAAAYSKETNATLIDYLTQQQKQVATALHNTAQIIPPHNRVEYKSQMQQMSSMLTMTQAKIQNLEGFLDNQNKQEIILNQRLKYLQQMPFAGAQLNIQEKVAKVEASLKINRNIMALIKQNLASARELEVALNEGIRALQLWNNNYVLEEKLKQIKTIKLKLDRELSQLYQANIPKTNTADKSPFQINSEAGSLINNQHVALIHQQLNALNLQKMVLKSNILLLKNTNTKTLQLALETYRDCLKQYATIEKSLQQMDSALIDEGKLLTDTTFKKSVSNLQKKLKNQINDIKIQKEYVVSHYDEAQNQLKKLISSRQTLAEYNVENLPLIVNKLIEIPNLSYKYIKTLALKVYDSYTWLDILPVTLLWIMLVLSILVFYLCNRFLKSLSKEKERFRLAGYLYDGVLTLLQRNTVYFCLFTMLWLGLFFTNISFSNYQLLFNLISVWFTFRVLILIARLALLERISDSSGKDVKLYYRLKWLFLFGGWTTALMVFSHLSPLPLLIQDIFNRLFMLFILAVSLVAWKSKDVIPYLLSPFLTHQKRYFKNAISLLVILVPITLFTTATIGILGFVNLAWTMCQYQAYILLVLVGFILIRGLMLDALELFSEWMISSLRNGWLWVEVFLKPIDKILRVILLLCSILALSQLYGLHSDSIVISSLHKLALYTIVNLPGLHVTVISTVEFFIVLSLFIWASKWTREFCYRWLYKNAKDAGIRNSLAVFTQYTVILLGAFITLHVLGLDFGGMSMILGGLAVGMGFGLRDFASNIIGGIMLLIERPVREGDLITIGEHEGRVAHIGIRTMRVSSWDNMEVLIPNAETFNKPFTNWTHQDSIVRTVVPIKVSRADDPIIIQQLIQDVLVTIPEIELDPPAQVFLKKIDEALIEFEVRYYIDVQIYTRFEVRSKLLFAITEQFRAAGIKHPVQPLAIEFKEGQEELLAKTYAST